ncbi:unnamed protein product, partial [Ilex paraguariensis]
TMMRNRTSGGAAASYLQGTNDGELMQTMREIARVMSQSEGNGMNSMIALKEFGRQNPSVFNGEPNPTVVENWIRQIEKILDAMGIRSNGTKVTLDLMEPKLL